MTRQPDPLDAFAAQVRASRKVGELGHVSIRRVWDRHVAAGVSEAVVAGFVTMGRCAVWELGGAPPEYPLSPAVEQAIVADEAIPSGAMTEADRHALARIGVIATVGDRVIAGERRN